MLLYGIGLYVAISMRRAVLVKIAPDRTTMYQVASDGTIANKFRLQIANRGHEQATVILSIEDLRGATLADTENAIVVNPGGTVQKEFEVVVPASAGTPAGVNHFQLVARVGQDKDSFPQTFITPMKDSQ